MRCAVRRQMCKQCVARACGKCGARHTQFRCRRMISAARMTVTSKPSCVRAPIPRTCRWAAPRCARLVSTSAMTCYGQVDLCQSSCRPNHYRCKPGCATMVGLPHRPCRAPWASSSSQALWRVRPFGERHMYVAGAVCAGVAPQGWQSHSAGLAAGALDADTISADDGGAHGLPAARHCRHKPGQPQQSLVACHGSCDLQRTPQTWATSEGGGGAARA